MFMKEMMEGLVIGLMERLVEREGRVGVKTQT
jgi:hypothetical protein